MSIARKPLNCILNNAWSTFVTENENFELKSTNHDTYNMKTQRRSTFKTLFSFFILSIALFLSSCGEDKSDEKDTENEIEVSAMPENARVLFENDFLKVVTVRLQSGERMPDMGNQDYVIYQPLDIENIYAGESSAQADSAGEQIKGYTAPNYNAELIADSTETIEWEPGKMYSSSGFQMNDSNMEANYLLIWNLKNPDMNGEAETMHNNDEEKSGESGKMYQILGSDKGVTLEEIYIPEGDTLMREERAPRALFYITSNTYHYISPDQSRRNVSNERGQVEWHETARASLINSGPTPAKILVIKPSGAVATMQ
ncbi:hypothetical protein AB9P05_08055 [Roseivirga sp. BDSF3-8]|uniref:hypothetical protein n=1 Tax=Roseivirga sp. BDSF3-8 TaxID=3241598 RepID=UPI0035317EDF